jgi:prepilin peptidase CpaA
MIGLPPAGLFTATGGLLLVMLLVVAKTDIDSKTIPNWATYTGVVWALLINVGQALFGTVASQQMLGAVGLSDSLIGFAALFFGLLVIFSFSGGGAGDVKLIGAIGAFMGLKNGFEAGLLSFLGCALIVMVQSLLKNGLPFRGQPAASSGVMLGEVESGASKVKTGLKAEIPLAPFFAMGVLLVLMRESSLIDFVIIGD